MSPSIGLIVGLPIGIILTLIASGIGIFGLIKTSSPRNFEELTVIIGSFITAFVIAVATAGFMYPWKSEYHHWTPVNGTVTSINKRLISDGDKGMNERFVLHLSDGKVRSCDDTRCSALKVGDSVSLKCKRAFQFFSTPGWDCRWAGRE